MKCARRHPLRRRGFSLVEVLLATFILGIGLIMVASIFPVAALWTRQATEDTVSQTVVQDALTVLKAHYGTALGQIPVTTVTSTDLSGFPSFTTIPVSERCYQFGNSTPFPAPNPAACTYYWSALIRVSPSTTGSAVKLYDVYILVFHKGEATQAFDEKAPPSGFTEVPNDRDTATPTNLTNSFNYQFEPMLVSGSVKDGTTTLPITGARPPVGEIGIGVTSGTVFREVVQSSGTTVKAIQQPAIKPGESVIYSPGLFPDSDSSGTGTLAAGPLVYVYQTTMSF